MARFSPYHCVLIAVLLSCGARSTCAQVVVDNDDGAPGYVETGSWATSGSTGYDGGTYRFASPGTADTTASWTGNIAETGDLEVFVWYVPGSNRATAKYDIQASDGTHTVFVDQTGGGLTWESLGTFSFNAGDNSITLDAAGSYGGTAVIADAVRFGEGDDPPPPPPDPVQVAPGVFHAEWELPAPLVVNVLEFDLADPQYTIEMGFPQGRRDYSVLNRVSQMASLYDTTGHTVVGAINCSYFASGITIHGAAGTRSNYIDPPTSEWWAQQTYMLQESGEGWAGSDLPDPVGTVRFADEAEMDLGVVNFNCGSNTLAIYTPDWGPSTGSTSPGVEVIVEGANYPLRASKSVTGTITAVYAGPPSVNNDIPAGGFVLSACPGAETELLAHAVAGQQVTVYLDQQPLVLNNARALCTGNAWMVKDGVPYHGGGPERHPRTVLAWSGTQHWFVTFDGRQAGYSVGASVAEMQDFLINSLAVQNAINLDGGGSTTMVVNGEVVNCPSDGAGTPCTGNERSVANSLLLVREEAGSNLPLTDDFAASGRSLSWDDKFSPNPVAAFSPAAPEGDGYVMTVANPLGGYETTSAGTARDVNCTAEAWIYCEHRPEVAADGFERVGLFARDDGNANFDSPDLGGGNCYALTYDSADGRIRAGVVVEGVLTDLLESAPVYEPTSGWRRFRLDCYGSSIRYSIDGVTLAETVDATHASGRCGLAYHEYFADDANAHGTRADNFAMYAMPFDWDIDGDVDWDDYLVYAFCRQGPAYQYVEGHFCLAMDGDHDLDVDFVDFALLQQSFTGTQ